MLKVSILIMFFFSMSFIGFPQTEWNGKIKKINDVTHVSNPDKPIYSIPNLKLEKVWQVGGEDPGFIMNVISCIDVDDRGRLYVSDVSEKNIKVFSSEGELLFTFGRQGQGPGEFKSPQAVSILPNMQLLVIDPRIVYPLNKFSLFNYNGSFIDAFNLDLKFNEYSEAIDVENRESLLSRHKIDICNLFSKNSLILFTYSTQNMKYQVKSLWIFSINNREANNIITLKKLSPRLTFIEKQNDRMFLNCQWCNDKNSNIYLLEDTYDYKINLFDSSGCLKSVISREFELPKKTREEYKEEMEKAEQVKKFYQKIGKSVVWELLKEKPIIFNPLAITRCMFCDDQNRLWILTNESFSSDMRFSFDVFSREGKYLMKVPFNGDQPRCLVYKKGYLYFADLRNDGFPWLFKYKISKK